MQNQVLFLKKNQIPTGTKQTFFFFFARFVGGKKISFKRNKKNNYDSNTTKSLIDLKFNKNQKKNEKKKFLEPDAF